MRIFDVVMRAGEVRFFLRPHRLDDFQRFIQLIHACACRRKVVAVGAVFGLVPAGANAQRESATAQHLQRRRHLRQQRRVAIRLADHRVSEVKRRMLRGKPRQRRETFWRIVQMIDHPDRIEVT